MQLHEAPRPTRPLDTTALALAFRIRERLAGRRHADEQVIAAVTVLAASAHPARAEQVRPRAGEPAALVERLAVWALHRADDAAIRRAARLLPAEAQPRPVVVPAPTSAAAVAA